MKREPPAPVATPEERARGIVSRTGSIRAIEDARAYLVDDTEDGQARTFVVTLSDQVQACDCWEKSRSSAHCRHIVAAIASGAYARA